jgi:hypothetical protein
MWEGQTVAILASGPSQSQRLCNLVAGAGLPAIAINDTFRLAPWAAMLYAADSSWWRIHQQEALKFAGLKVTCNNSVEFKAVHLLKQSGAEGFDPDPAAVRTGGNSGYQAIHVALHAKAKRILLLGFDMSDRDGHHWHGKHKQPLRTTDSNTYKIWCERFKALNKRGAEIINCTPASALTCFPKMELEAAL